MAESSGDKTEAPTDKKLADARKRGQIWKSRDLTGAMVFFTGYAVMAKSVDLVYTRFNDLFREAVQKIQSPGLPLEDATSVLNSGIVAVLTLCLPVVAAAAVVGGLSDFLQVGPLFTGDPIIPKLEKLNAFEGLKNLVNKKAIVDGFKNTAKVGLALYLAWGVLRDHLGLVMQTVHATPVQIASVVGELVYRLTVKVGLLLVLTAIFDLWWQHRSYMEEMKMTKDEVKREYKESEGDPHHKAKRKELHQEILEHSAMENVANADVIITNPEHVAIALRYRKAEDAAPLVLAKGVDSVAAQIRGIAAAKHVPMVRNVPLAHALLRVDVGDAVPEELYDAVAEVLNFVYTLGGESMGDRS